MKACGWAWMCVLGVGCKALGLAPERPPESRELDVSVGVISDGTTSRAVSSVEYLLDRYAWDEEDQLLVTQGKETLELDAKSDEPFGSPEPGVETRWTFSRWDLDRPVQLTAEMPEGFEITSPAPGERIPSEADEVRITWSDPNPAYQVGPAFDSPCLDQPIDLSDTFAEPDDGEMSFPLVLLVDFVGEGCEVTFTVVRTALGHTQRERMEWNVFASQTRSITFQLDP